MAAGSWKYGFAGLAVTAALVAIPPLVAFNGYALQVITYAYLFATLALAWNLLGISGAISLGHAGFLGIGAYTAAVLSLKYSMPPWLTIPMAAATAAGAGAVLGGVVRRLRGPYFALATLAWVQIPKVLAGNWDSVTRGSLGIVGVPSLVPATSAAVPGGLLTISYYLLLLYGLAVLGLVALIFRTTLGLGLHAVRGEETAAAAAGVPVERLRLLAMLASSAITGAGGGFFAHLVGYLDPDLAFSLHFSAAPMIMALCGGRFTILGPALGALILYPLDQFVFHPLLPAGHEIIYGLVLVAAMLLLPAGVWGSRQQPAKADSSRRQGKPRRP